MFNAIPIITQGTEKSALKFIWKHKSIQIAKAILSTNSNTGGIIIPDSKLYYRDTAMKIPRYWYKTRQEDQWTRRHKINS
jgi:hypothetical protein